MALEIEIHDETAPLEMVILGIGTDQGTREKSTNPKANKHLEDGTYPLEDDILREITEFENVLIKNNVKVFRPQNIENVNQIFTRDIGFVIGDNFLESRMSVERGGDEIKGIKYLTHLIKRNKVIKTIPKEALIEGGDVVMYGDKIFVGKSKRTNNEGFDYIRTTFQNKEVIQIEVNISDNAEENVVHLDCAFQPIGLDCAIIYEGGIRNPEKILKHFKEENLIRVSKKQAYRMFPNIFSISTNKIVIEKKFFELKYKLKLLQRDFEIIEINYCETSKLSGLLRCSTLPLKRGY
jgi:N-dimethylarginine dimethylaminohydrolase